MTAKAPPLSLPKPGFHEARMQRIRRHIGAFKPTGECIGEHDILQLGPLIRDPSAHASLVDSRAVHIIKINRSAHMRPAGDVDDPCGMVPPSIGRAAGLSVGNSSDD